MRVCFVNLVLHGILVNSFLFCFLEFFRLLHTNNPCPQFECSATAILQVIQCYISINIFEWVNINFTFIEGTWILNRHYLKEEKKDGIWTRHKHLYYLVLINTMTTNYQLLALQLYSQTKHNMLQALHYVTLPLLFKECWQKPRSSVSVTFCQWTSDMYK